MYLIGNRGWPGVLQGLWLLMRILPVISWSISGIFLGVALAVGRVGAGGIFWGDVLLMLLGALLLHGIAAHAMNDQEDWRSGTDQISPGILSGGSKVIQRGFIHLRGLTYVAQGGILLAAAIALYFVIAKGPVIWLFLLLGIWAGVAYSQPPLRLAYRPFWGEWATAYPAALACTVGPYYILASEVSVGVWLAALLHTAFCMGWLMQHHLPDIPADLQAHPVKMTTAAFVFRRFGLEATPWLVTAYFSLVFPLSWAGGILLDPIFFLSSFFVIPCIMLALQTEPGDPVLISRQEQAMIGITITHTALLSLVFAWAG